MKKKEKVIKEKDIKIVDGLVGLSEVLFPTEELKKRGIRTFAEFLADEEKKDDKE